MSGAIGGLWQVAAIVCLILGVIGLTSGSISGGGAMKNHPKTDGGPGEMAGG